MSKQFSCFLALLCFFSSVSFSKAEETNQQDPNYYYYEGIKTYITPEEALKGEIVPNFMEIDGKKVLVELDQVFENYTTIIYAISTQPEGEYPDQVKVFKKREIEETEELTASNPKKTSSRRN